MSGRELELVTDAFETNWLTGAGPHVDAFEQEMAEFLSPDVYTLAVSSGTAALHLVLREIGVGPGDRVAASTLTFAGSVFPILYLGGVPVLVDSETTSGNVDAGLMAEYLDAAARKNELPKAVVAVHLYGQHADVAPLLETCRRHGVALVEDSAESLGATYQGRQTGTTADYAILSFNGNKIITTTGGGMVVARSAQAIAAMRKWANQAREPALEYLHREEGYNYRLSNVLAAIGRGQLSALGDRVSARQLVFERYRDALERKYPVAFQKKAPWGTHSRWLTVMYLERSVIDARAVITGLSAHSIEARPVWRPMHMQPLFASAPVVGGAVAQELFETGVCLPSSSSLSTSDQDRVIAALEEIFMAHPG